MIPPRPDIIAKETIDLLTKLQKVHWKFYFAKWIVRLGIFYKATDFGVWVSFFGGGVGTLLFKGMVFTHSNQGVQSLGEAIKVFFQGAFFFLFCLYLIWETIQGIKWLHHWSENYLYYAKAENYNQRDRGY